MKIRLQNQYKDIAEKIILMALESVEYSEDKACKILDIVTQEDLEEETKKRTASLKKSTKKGESAEKNVSFKDSRYFFQISIQFFFLFLFNFLLIAV